MELEGALLSTQEPDTGPQPKPDESSLASFSFSKTHFNIHSHLHLGIPSSLFPSGFPIKICINFSHFPCILHALSISYSLIWAF
jgi:hypothetical protein